MKLNLAAEDLAHALASRAPLASEDVFGAEALALAGPAAPPDAPCHPQVSEAELRLLRTGYARLLGEGEFAEVLDVLGGSDRFVPQGAVSSLLGPGPGAGAASPHRRVMLRVADELSQQPLLPLQGEAFDAALVTLDVGALRRPLEVFREVGRVLRPGGLVVVSFGPAARDEAHTRLWSDAGDRDRLMLAEAFLEFSAAGFTAPTSITLLEGDEGVEWRDAGAPHAHVVFAYRDEVAAAHRGRPPFPPPSPQPAKTKDDIRYDEAGRPCC